MMKKEYIAPSVEVVNLCMKDPILLSFELPTEEYETPWRRSRRYSEELDTNGELVEHD